MDALTLITGPTIEPVALAEVKAHCRVDHNDEDELLRELIRSAREQIEEDDGLALISQTWEVALPAFPYVTRSNPTGAIVVPRPPLQSVTSVKYYDTDGVEQTLSSSLYTVNIRAFPGEVTPAYGEVWPSTREIPNAVVVKYVCGFGDDESDVPRRIRQAMLVMVADAYEHREDTVVGATINVRRSVRTLRNHYRTPGA